MRGVAMGRRGQESANTGKYYEAFGEAARCFEVTWKGAESPGCLRHRCHEGLLYLKLGAEYVACPVDGGMVRAPLLVLPS
jgi:hypothetical protein